MIIKFFFFSSNRMLPQIYVPVVKIKELPTPERKLINEVISVCKLILVNPTTSASVERSFPQLAARRLASLNNDTRTIHQLDNIKQSTNKQTFSCRPCKRIFRRNHNRRRTFGKILIYSTEYQPPPQFFNGIYRFVNSHYDCIDTSLSWMQ